MILIFLFLAIAFANQSCQAMGAEYFLGNSPGLVHLFDNRNLMSEYRLHPNGSTPLFKVPEHILDMEKNPSTLIKLYHFKVCNHLSGSFFDGAALINVAKYLNIMEEVGRDGTRELEIERIEPFLHYIEKEPEAHIWKEAKSWAKWAWRFLISRQVSNENERLYSNAFVELRHIKENYPKIIDSIAESLLSFELSRYRVRDATKPHYESFAHTEPVSEEAARSFACYIAADGYNQWVRLSRRENVLKFIDGKTYWNNVIPFDHVSPRLAHIESELIKRNPMWTNLATEHEAHKRDPNGILERGVKLRRSLNSRGKRMSDDRKKIAYFMMVHKDLDDIIATIDAIYSDESVILIHVDRKGIIMKAELINYLKQNPTKYNLDNIRVMKTSFDGMWGHATLVNAHLAGYFELLDMNADWEYVINLSGNDYPLWSNDIIYNHLRNSPNPNLNYIEFWQADAENTFRMKHYPYLYSENSKSGQVVKSSDRHPTLSGLWHDHFFFDRLSAIRSVYKPLKITQKLELPFPHWRLYKQHQWMTLKRSFIEVMRRSPTVMSFLAYAQFTMIPDESFFITVAANLQTVDIVTMNPIVFDVVNDNRRYLKFEGGMHPKMFVASDSPTLKERARRGDWFFRKFQPSKEQKLKQWLDFERKNKWIEY